MDYDNENQDDTGGASAWLERMTGRSMGDIRIHDSAQAGDLARRLGARAFTVGRDVYVRSELTNNDAPEGRALLAHEVTHAIEQTGGSVADMPLLKPQVSRGGSAGSGATPVQRTAIGGTSPASLPPSESRAESVESSARQSRQGSGAQGGGGQSGQQGQQSNTQASSATDPEELAERVYALMVHEMLIDMERSAHL